MQIIHCRRTPVPIATLKHLFTIILPFLLLASKNSPAQTVSLTLKKVPLENALIAIQQQTGYFFVYTREQIKSTSPVSISVKNASLTNALDRCFRGQPLSYVIEANHIIIQSKTWPGTDDSTSKDLLEVQGKVTNESAEPIPAVTVSVKETGRTITADDKGIFKISSVRPDGILIFSAVGYISQTVPINGGTFLFVKMRQAIVDLEETLVKGYYATTRKTSTGTISKITSKDIETQPVSNPLATLQGRIPGLFITQANGLPGSGFSVRLRGQNSIQNGNSPLFVIDGVPFLTDRDQLTQRSGLMANNPFNTVNPGDIESIEVLKDADATSIYGSRGANGVILITTRKGKGIAQKLDISFQTGWGKPAATADFLNTAGYLQMRREAFVNDNIEPDLYNAPDLLLWDTTRYINWKERLIGNTARSANMQIGFTHNTRFLKYTLHGDYYKETTVFPGDFYEQRASLSMSATHVSQNNKFSMTLNSSFASNKSELPAEDMTQYISMPPNMYEPFNAHGILQWQENGYAFGNPYKNLFQKNRGQSARFMTNGLISYRFTNALSFKTSAGYHEIRFDEYSAQPIAAQDPASDPRGAAIFGHKFLSSWIIEPQLDYSTTILSAGRISTFIGATLQRTENKASLLSGSGYTVDALLNSIAGATGSVATDTYSKYKYGAIYGRLNFNWKSIHLFNITARRDGSSRFAPQRRFANFGAIGYGWVFSEENFFKANRNLSFGKLKASYGMSGNDQIGDYQFLDTWTTTIYPYNGTPSLYPTRLYNPAYVWERNNKMEAGIELGFLEDRFYAAVNWFNNRSNNQIIRYSLPEQTGFKNVLMNFPGIVQNKGTEIELRSKNISGKHFSWQSNFNITFQKNKLRQFPGLETSSYASTYVVGQSLNVVRGLRYLGVNTETGIYEFEDLNGDGSINHEDYTVLGHTDPDFYGGFQNTIRIQNFEIDFLFQFVKQKGRHAILSLQNAIGGTVNQPVAVGDRWRKPEDIATYERYTQDFSNPAYYPATFDVANSGAALTDASFIRLKNISASYDVGKSLLQHSKLKSTRLFILGQNILTFTKYIGADPENQGLTVLPPLKMITIGIKISL